jgi:hypothetical protein
MYKMAPKKVAVADAKTEAKKPVETKAVAEKPVAEKPVAEKAVEAVKEVKAPAKKPAAKKPAEKKTAEKKPAEKKPAAKKPAAKKAAEVIIQSELGGEITADAILAKVGAVDKIYVRVDQNKAYWVRGEETGSVDLW